MTQTREQSAREAATNTAAGFVLSYALGILVVAPALLWWQSRGGDIDNPLVWFAVSLLFTLLSLARNFVVRRFYVWFGQ